MTTLAPGLQVLAFKLQEAGMMQSNVRARLSDAVADVHRGTGNYGYYVDHSGDDSTGDVVYSCNGDLRMCGYEIADVGGKSAVNLDTENSKNVVPTTTYQEEADDDDHYSAMQESLKTEGLYTELPLYERFISKDERDKAGADDFAGKGKSFPILKPEDVMAAVRSMGRAGDKNMGPSGIKGRIIAIAKRKGWTKYLPKAWTTDASESQRTPSRKYGKPLRSAPSGQGNHPAGQGLPAADVSVRSESGPTVNRETSGDSITLTESAATLEPILLRESRSDYEIKLIAPGKGSSAIYPAEVLRRDGPNVFKAGTHVYLNHPTAAEEAARPEGDVKNLAGVLSTSAVYHEAHAKGPGLYARMKVFADHATTVEEKAPHVGMSIRASGVAESGKKQDGLPVLKELTSAESVDVVTRAGAGGMILTESARTRQDEEVSDMDATALNKLQESLTAGLATLALREAKISIRELTVAALETVRLPNAAKADILERLLENVSSLMKDGSLDETLFNAALTKESQRVGRLLASVSGSGRIEGLGTSLTIVETDPAKKIAAREAAKLDEAELVEAEERAFTGIMGGNSAAAKQAAKKSSAA